jgi:23S rRNA (pseudouridine1915-N3)-methyltransferase
LPGWAEAACADYERRMPRGYELSRTRLKRLEPKAVASKYRDWRLVALDERGRDLTTAQFAKLLDRDSAFVIGGADGLPQEFKKDAALLLRLSALTLPHALAQVVLVEQIYRAATLLSGHPYHRG